MLILSTQFWEVTLSEDQKYLGRMVVVCKRTCPQLSLLTHQERLDFADLVEKLEPACKEAFGVTMFNRTCFMNEAYNDPKPNPQVHWHMRPRYHDPVEFEGLVFEDKEFGKHYEREKNIVSGEYLEKITNHLKKFLY